MTKKPGRNLVVCADGTGNSAGRAQGTNVFRIYDALDHREVDDQGNPLTIQLAIHDDGVGVSSNPFTKILGGAFGYGLAAKVRALYAWLCQHYDEGDEQVEADQIYLFGFSRGAFTVRCLAGMIAHVGLKPTDSGADAEKSAELAWKIYKSSFRAKKRGSLKLKDSVRVTIRFLGVWDTVDAYGFPIDWVKKAMALASQWLAAGLSFLCTLGSSSNWAQRLRAFVFSYTWTRFQDQRPSPLIEHVRHAIALDDERHTFHPLVFDESLLPGQKDAAMIKQVWFAGAHSDVGGGYPRESLAYVPLLWMMQEAETAITRIHSDGSRAQEPLRFSQNLRAIYESRANPLGPQHHARDGLAAFYRYKPRDPLLSHNNEFANGPDFELGTSRRDAGALRIPDVHSSVLRRVATIQYCPQVLFRFCSIGSDLEQEVLLDAEVRQRIKAHHLHRRLLWWLLAAWLVAFIIFPFLLNFALNFTSASPWVSLGKLSEVHDALSLKSEVQEVLVQWRIGMCEVPWPVAPFLVALWLLKKKSKSLKVETQARAQQLWSWKKEEQTLSTAKLVDSWVPPKEVLMVRSSHLTPLWGAFAASALLLLALASGFGFWL